MTSLSQFLDEQKKLLEQEHDAELEQQRLLIELNSLRELCAAGLCLNRLHLISTKSTYRSRKILKFARKNLEPFGPLPDHKFSSGDTVSVAYSNSYRTSLSVGLVNRVSDQFIYVTIDREAAVADWLVASQTFCVLQSVNHVTHDRLKKCLHTMANTTNLPGTRLLSLLFHDLPFPTPSTSNTGSSVVYDDLNLNGVQQAAVNMCTNRTQILSLVHGPPGTGKTRTICEIITQCVLVCAPSNVAVDNIVSRLVSVDRSRQGLRLVRLGHAARSNATLRPFTLDAQLDRHEQQALIQDIRTELEQGGGKAMNRFERRNLRKDLVKELHERENKAITDVLRSARVVLSTLSSAACTAHPLKVLDKPHLFDVCIIDECAQSTELACWLAVLNAKRLVLAGDHCQLPPTVISQSASQAGLSITLMDRINREFREHLPQICTLLTIQYRMNTAIMQWSSDTFYEAKLIAHHTVADHTLSGLAGVSLDECNDNGCDHDHSHVLNASIHYIDTADCDMHELNTPSDQSKANTNEVRLVYLYVSKLVAAGVPEKDIAVLSPYNLQVQLLRAYVQCEYKQVSVRSIDGYQGQESEVLVLSLVRSNPHHEVGFLSDSRRMNVAVTRARRHLCVIGDSDTVQSEARLHTLLVYIRGCTRAVCTTAAQYYDELHNDGLDINVDQWVTDIQTGKSPEKSIGKPSTPQKRAGQPAGKCTRKAEKPVKQLPVQGHKEQTAKENVIEPEEEDSWLADIRQTLEDYKTETAAGAAVGLLYMDTQLTANQRRLVHIVADQLGLSHHSQGDADTRQIVIGQRTSGKAIDDWPKQEHNNASAGCAESSVPISASEAGLRLDGVQKLSTNAQASVKAKPSNNHKKKKSKSAGGSKSKEDDIDVIMARLNDDTTPSVTELDEQRVLEEAMHSASRCAHSLCKTAITFLGIRCQHCHGTFCTKHAQAEVHGCDREARRYAQQAFRNQANGLTHSTKQSDIQKKEVTKHKMSEKLKELQKQRGKADKKK